MNSHVTNKTSSEGTSPRTTRRRILKATSLALSSVAITGTTVSLAANPNSDTGKVSNDDRQSTGKTKVTPAVPPREVGTLKLTYKMFSGADFKVRSSSVTYAYNQGGSISPTSANGEFQVKLDLPQGVIIYEADFFIVDNDGTNDVECCIFSFNPVDASVVNRFYASTTGASTTVQTLLVSTGANGLFVDNYNYAYNLVIYTNGAASSSVKINGARVAYIDNGVLNARRIILNPGN